MCDACAVECAKFQDAHCQACAKFCRQCAEECRKMSM
ncbi:four-helix bundle copper-binding protein [Bacillus sp. V3B]